MAINKTTVIERVEVFPPQDISATNTNKQHETLNVTAKITFVGTGQNSSDVDLPVVQTHTKTLEYYSDEANLTKTSVAGEDALVQVIANAVWS